MLSSEQERYENKKKTPSGKEIVRTFVSGVHPNRGWGLKDATRNLDAFAGKNGHVRTLLTAGYENRAAADNPAPAAL